MTFAVVCVIFILFIMYKRYIPVLSARSIHLKDFELDKIKIMDVRDYNLSNKEPIDGAINIPIAYLKRNYKEIPNSDLHLIVSSNIEKNMGIRFLRKKGFRVVGYTFIGHNQLIVKKKYRVKEG
ncbi:rhodanese-like domain-containing protein [Neobacillus sp. Marseille-QA0830]